MGMDSEGGSVRPARDDWPDPDPDSTSDHDRTMEAIKALDERLSAIGERVQRIQYAAYATVGVVVATALRQCGG